MLCIALGSPSFTAIQLPRKMSEEEITESLNISVIKYTTMVTPRSEIIFLKIQSLMKWFRYS